MKVAIDSGPLENSHKVRGIGVHTRELLRALGNRVVPFDFSDQKSKIKNQKFDVLHYTSFHPFFVSLPWQKPRNTKIALTIHDLIPLIYPAHYPAGIRGKMKFLINKFLIRKNVDAIVTISETSKKDICRFLKVKPEKVHVVYLAPRRIFGPITNHQLLTTMQKKYGLPNSFVLYVGDINYNKNISNLVRACEIAKIPLVMVGKQAREIEKGDLNHPELTHLKGTDFSKVLKLGFVPDSDLAAIYNLATVYCQPSLYEGFALPILEAIACGCPVIASKIQVHTEIAEGAITFVDPKDTEDIARGILNPGKLGVLPREYSWEKTAKDTLEIYKNV